MILATLEVYIGKFESGRMDALLWGPLEAHTYQHPQRTFMKGLMVSTAEARELEHDPPPTPKQKSSKTSIHHPISMLQLLESTVLDSTWGAFKGRGVWAKCPGPR